MMDLEQKLCRLPDVQLALDARGEASIELNGKRHVCGPHTLRLLELFAQPKAAAEVLDILKPSLAGTHEWLQALRTIQHLREIGVLTADGSSPSSAPFDHASIHIAMLNDESRTHAFIRAIQRTVREGDVVVDIGTGTGVLAATAAKAGAQKVYAIEAGSVRLLADRLFRGNGLSERISVVPGWSTQVTLPEPADLVVGEVLGNDPFGEDVLETYRDAVRRFLKPGGKVIPQQVELWGILVELPAETVGKHRFEAGTLKHWSETYELDFTTLLAENRSATFTAAPQTARTWNFLSAPFPISQADLQTGQGSNASAQVKVPITAGGKLHGMLLFFTSRLCEGIGLTTHPREAGDDCHWRNVVRLFPEVRDVRGGDTTVIDFTNGYQHAAPADAASV